MTGWGIPTSTFIIPLAQLGGTTGWLHDSGKDLETLPGKKKTCWECWTHLYIPAKRNFH